MYMGTPVILVRGNPAWQVTHASLYRNHEKSDNYGNPRH